MSCEVLFGSGEQCITEDVTPVTAFSFNPPPNETTRLTAKVLAVSHDRVTRVWEWSARVEDVDGVPSIKGQGLGLIVNGDVAAANWDCYLEVVSGEVLFKVKGANNRRIKWHIEVCGVGMQPPAAP